MHPAAPTWGTTARMQSLWRCKGFGEQILANNVLVCRLLLSRRVWRCF
jgi:hypothetical protein